MNKLASYRARWHTQAASARQLWQRSSTRDKRILRIAAVVLPLMLLWFVVIEPPLQRIDHWQTELPRLRSQLGAVESVLAEVQGPTLAPLGGDTQQALEQQLSNAGLSGCFRLQQADGQWQLTVDNAPADALMNWLLDDAPRLRLTVRRARLQRSATQDSEAAARISGVVSMEQAPGAKESS